MDLIDFRQRRETDKKISFQHAKFWITLFLTLGIISVIIVALIIGFHPHHVEKRQHFTPQAIPPPPLSSISGAPDFQAHSTLSVPPTFSGFTVHQFDPVTKTGVGVATSGSTGDYTQALFQVNWVDNKLEYGAQISDSRSSQTALLTAYSGSVDPSHEYIAEYESQNDIIYLHRRDRNATKGFELYDQITKAPGSLITGTSTSNLQNSASSPIYVNDPLFFMRPHNTPDLYLVVATSNRALYFYNMRKNPSIAAFTFQTPNADSTTLQDATGSFGNVVMSFAGDTTTVSSDQKTTLQIAQVSVVKESFNFTPQSVVLPFSTDTEYFKSVVLYDDKVLGLSDEELVYYRRGKKGPIFEDWEPFHSVKIDSAFESFGLHATQQGEVIAFYSHKSTVTPAQNAKVNIYLNYNTHLRYQNFLLARPALGVTTGPLVFRVDDTYYLVVHTLNDSETDTLVTPELYQWKPTLTTT